MPHYQTTPQTITHSGELDHLPVAALLALAMTGFTGILTETLPAGLLSAIATSLRVSLPAAGQLVTAYALGSFVAAIPIISFTQRYRRKPTLLAAIVGLFVFNSITAISGNFVITLLARFLAGVSSALAWGLLAGYARRLVAGPLKGKALAIAMAGTPVALSIGVPAGALLGHLIGWRAIFLGMSASTAMLVVWVMLAMPDIPGQSHGQRHTTIGVLRLPGLIAILATTFAWMTAHNILYTYIAPFAGLSGTARNVDLLLLAFGLAALAGLSATGTLIDRHLRILVLGSLIAFGAMAFGVGLDATSSPAIVVGIIIWGLSFGGAATLILTACADASGDGMDIATATVTTVWNAAIASGGLIGGLFLDRLGAKSLPWAVVALVVAAYLFAAAAHRHGFRRGSRGSAAV